MRYLSIFIFIISSPSYGIFLADTCYCIDGSEYSKSYIQKLEDVYSGPRKTLRSSNQKGEKIDVIVCDYDQSGNYFCKPVDSKPVFGPYY